MAGFIDAARNLLNPRAKRERLWAERQNQQVMQQPAQIQALPQAQPASAPAAAPNLNFDIPEARERLRLNDAYNRYVLQEQVKGNQPLEIEQWAQAMAQGQ